MRVAIALGFLAVLSAGPACAYEFTPLAPMDEQVVDAALLADVFGAWELRDKTGKKRCRITLLRDMGIGGRQIEVAPGCEKIFPVMGDIAAWRLQEGWTIDLVDGLRKTRVRLETPDARYIAIGDDKDVAGIDTLVKAKSKGPKSK